MRVSTGFRVGLDAERDDEHGGYDGRGGTTGKEGRKQVEDGGHGREEGVKNKRRGRDRVTGCPDTVAGARAGAWP